MATAAVYQASYLLGLSRTAFDSFLKERGIHEHAYSVDDLKEDEDAATARK